MFSVWGNWRAEGKVCFVKVSNTGCNDAKINRHNHAFLNRPFSTILFSHWQSTSNYPHEYGEYTSRSFLSIPVVESPPYVWEVLLSVNYQIAVAGITPMCMGSTPPCRLGYSRYRNHPHEYGEYCTPSPTLAPWSESPPCVWGVRLPKTANLWPLSITPMSMGSTGRVTVNTNYIKNHPHVYGEYSK